MYDKANGKTLQKGENNGTRHDLYESEKNLANT